MKVTTNITIIAQGVEITITLEEAKKLLGELNKIFSEPAPIYPWYPPLAPPEPLTPGPWAAPDSGTPPVPGPYTT